MEPLKIPQVYILTATRYEGGELSVALKPQELWSTRFRNDHAARQRAVGTMKRFLRRNGNDTTFELWTWVVREWGGTYPRTTRVKTAVELPRVQITDQGLFFTRFSVDWPVTA